MAETSSSQHLLSADESNGTCTATKQLLFGSFLMIASGLSLGVGLYRSTTPEENLGSLKNIPPAGADTLIGTGVTCFWGGVYFLYHGAKKIFCSSTQKKLDAVSLRSPFFSSRRLPIRIESTSSSFSLPEELVTGSGEFDSLTNSPRGADGYF